MDIKEVIRLYREEGWTLKLIAKRVNTDYRVIRKILVEHNIKINQRGPREGKKMSKEDIFKNMRGHLRHDIPLEWLNKFDDIEKLKFFHNITSRHKMDVNTYKAFLEKFYYDKTFNFLYLRWLNKGKDKWFRPTIDHINPTSNGGNFELDNLRFITWFENWAKSDMSLEEWENVKDNIQDYFV